MTATARRTGQSRRPRPAGGARYRWVTFGPALPAGPAGWITLGHPLHEAGLLILAALTAGGILLIPVLALTLITTPGVLARAAVPKSWRKWWRHHDWRKWWRHPMDHPGPPGALIQRVVRAADRNRCVHCGTTAAVVYAAAVLKAQLAGTSRLPQSTLQLDHYFPWSLGGLLSFWNFYLLCPRCNMAKGPYWEFVHGGHTDGHGTLDVGLAAAILASERQLRRNPGRSLLRCWRAAWAL